MTAISKRHLLQMLAALAAVSAAEPARAALTPAIAAIDAAGATEIGRAWLALHPADAATLQAEVFPRGWDDDARPVLADRVRGDFARDALFVHRGWYLSETEARLCALIALG